jgi:hypothetical protein
MSLGFIFVFESIVTEYTLVRYSIIALDVAPVSHPSPGLNLLT